MEWIPRAMSSGKSVSPTELKMCALCGALNHETNSECYTCGWYGQFGYESATIELAWRRLVHQHEIVLIEHVTAHRTTVVGDFGKPRQTNVLQRLAGGLRSWYQKTLSARRVRSKVRPQTNIPQPAAPKSEI